MYPFRVRNRRGEVSSPISQRGLGDPTPYEESGVGAHA